MRERLLRSSGADMSHVYVIEDGGTLVGAVASSVFHWDDLSGRDIDVIENEGGYRAGAVGWEVGVAVSDLLRAWQIVTDLGHLLGEPVQVLALCCPSCGGDDVADDGSEDSGPGTVSRWHMCHTCDASWTDTYVIGARTVLTSGKPEAASVGWEYDGDEWRHCDRSSHYDDDANEQVCSKCSASFSWGDAVEVDSSPGGPADHLDMAYEDANGCGVEL